jgi:hypothetical protein
MSGIALLARPPQGTFGFHHTILSSNSTMAVSLTTASREDRNWTTGRGQCRDKVANLDEQQCRAGPYLNAGGARLRETFVLTQQVDDGLASR